MNLGESANLSVKRDGVIRHILKRENVNGMKKIAFLREWSFWHPTWLGKLGVNMNFRQFMSVIYAKKSVWKRVF